MTPEFWDVVKIIGGAYLVYVLNQSSRNHEEMFRRIRALELAHAANHGYRPTPKGEADADT